MSVFVGHEKPIRYHTALKAVSRADCEDFGIRIEDDQRCVVIEYWADGWRLVEPQPAWTRTGQREAGHAEAV